MRLLVFSSRYVLLPSSIILIVKIIFYYHIILCLILIIFGCPYSCAHSNMFKVKVLKNSIKLLARLSFSLTRSINGFKDLDRTYSLILILYFHMHYVKFHLMKSSKRCLDTLYFESPFEFMSMNIFNSCEMRISIMFSFHTFCFSDPTIAITHFILFIFAHS